MKIVVFGDERRTGALIGGDHIVDLNRAYAASLPAANAAQQADTRVPSRLDEFVAAGEPALEGAEQAIAHAKKSGALGILVHDAKSIKLHAPWPRRRLAMCASNYAGHIAGMQSNTYGRGDAIAQVNTAAAEMRKVGQFGFFKVIAEVVGPTDDVQYPKRAKYFDYEGEAAVIIGKRGKDIRSGEIEDYVWGVTLCNDWTIRDPTPARVLQYNTGKNFDFGCTLGPCILVGEDDFCNIDVQTRVNGQIRQSFNTRDMVFTFGEILEFLSRDFTFVPGDIISGGTGGGTAQDSTKPLPDGTRPLDLYLKVGDVVEVSSPQIGVISNRVVGG